MLSLCLLNAVFLQGININTSEPGNNKVDSRPESSQHRWALPTLVSTDTASDKT